MKTLMTLAIVLLAAFFPSIRAGPIPVRRIPP